MNIYSQFTGGSSYILFKKLIEAEITDIIESIKSSKDKEEVWKLKNKIDTLNDFITQIEDKSKDKEEKED